MIYSESEQQVTFTVATASGGGKSGEFSHTETLSPGDNWRKLTLGASDFKSPFGVCESWEDVFGLKIVGKAPVIVASMLWV